MGYSKDTIKGVSWISLLRIITRIIAFVRLAILGRLLTPAHFGYFALATLLLSLLEILTETGINILFVQEKKNIKEFLSSAWIISIIRGVFLGLIILVTAPFIAIFFNSQQATSVIMLMALVPFIRGFINPAIISYQKNLLFNIEFRLRFVLFLIDAFVTVALAFLTHDATSFVWGLIASALLEVILSYALIRVWPKFEFHYQQLKYIIRKGWWVTLTGIFSYFADNGDNIVVGKILGSASLGIYQVAYKFSTLPVSEITNVVNQVVFPVYTKFSDDKKRLFNAFIKVTFVSSFAALVLGIIIFIFAKPVILVIMGSQWTQAIPVMQILIIYGVIRTVFGNFAPLFLSLGKQNFVAKMTFVRVFGLLSTIIPFIIFYGMIGAGFAMLFSIFLEIPVILYYTYTIFRQR